jgi:hypothetical protein
VARAQLEYFRGSAGFQPAVSPISNRQTANISARLEESTPHRLPALGYNSLEICYWL